MELNKKLDLLEKGLVDVKEVDEVLKKLDDSLMQIIVIKGGVWCSEVVYGGKGNRSTFSDFKSGKHNMWTDRRKIDVYRKIWKELNKS